MYLVSKALFLSLRYLLFTNTSTTSTITTTSTSTKLHQGGFTMHRIAGDNVNPMMDTMNKIAAINITPHSKILDTCMGLGKDDVINNSSVYSPLYPCIALSTHV